jgi:hypothetical protein
MTEHEWQTADDPRPMLEFLKRRASARKLRLFACACCRRVEHLLREPWCKPTIDVAERYLDGQAGEEEWNKQIGVGVLNTPMPYDYPPHGHKVGAWYAYRAAGELLHGQCDWKFDHVAWAAAAAAATAAVGWDDEAWDAALRAAWVGSGQEPLDGDDWDEVRGSDAVWEMGWDSFTCFPAWAVERAVQAALLRDIVGNPFVRRKVRLLPAWRTWNGGAVSKLAQAIYLERALERLPILADALEEAGCTSAEILDHCRKPGVHVRGCWVLDQLLGKA